MKDYDVRVPGRLLIAPLPGWIKLVWIAVRSIQGKNRTCRASLRMIGERCRSEHGSMDKGQVSRAIARLIADGWMLRDGRELRCCQPENVDSSSTIDGENVDSSSTIDGENVDEESTKPSVDEESTLTGGQRPLTGGQRNVDEGSTPSENQLKTKRENQHSQRAREAEARELWNQLALRHGLPQCRKLSKDRRAAIRLRGAEILADWPAVEDAFAESSFLRGESGSWSGATFDFLFCRRESLNKILEGQYRDKFNRNGHAPRQTAVERSNNPDFGRILANAEGAYALLDDD